MSRPWLIALIPLAYLIGSIPFGLIIGLAKGVDPRQAGSGNIGATNVGRLLGGKFFAIVFTLDLLKGLLPTAFAAVLLHGAAVNRTDFILWLLVGFAVIAGHMFSLFLGFKGGKGVATSAGVLLGVFPYFTLPGVVSILTWVILFKATRYVSLASIFGSALFPVFYLVVALAMGWPVFGAQLPLLIFATAMATLIVYKHRTNIIRLRAGTESRLVSNGTSSTPPSATL
ncbi:MAG: glycerol-3-phosphate 1-O-acyltransferase PlsY [Tepidisphaeraceae bacterium]